VWPVELLREFADDVRAGGIGKATEFAQVFAEILAIAPALERRPYQEGAFDRLLDVDLVLGDRLLLATHRAVPPGRGERNGVVADAGPHRDVAGNPIVDDTGRIELAPDSAETRVREIDRHVHER
jgi:hypothetical protein